MFVVVSVSQCMLIILLFRRLESFFKLNHNKTFFALTCPTHFPTLFYNIECDITCIFKMFCLYKRLICFVLKYLQHVIALIAISASTSVYVTTVSHMT